MGGFSQRFLFPSGPAVSPPLSPDYPAVGAAGRFAVRAKSSGFAHINQLWGEAIGQVANGRLTHPAELDDVGGGLPLPHAGNTMSPSVSRLYNSEKIGHAMTSNTDMLIWHLPRGLRLSSRPGAISGKCA